MTKNIELEITEADISKAREASGAASACCPIAQAIRRQFDVDVVVVGNLLWFAGPRWGELQNDAQALVRQFDTGEVLQPTTIHLTEN